MRPTCFTSSAEARRRCRFGSRAYAAEELIAELRAAFLSAEFGFDGDVRNAGYIASWIELLKADKRAFFTACSKAQAAADYLREAKARREAAEPLAEIGRSYNVSHSTISRL
jgi:antirestriction protein ArdC